MSNLTLTVHRLASVIAIVLMILLFTTALSAPGRIDYPLTEECLAQIDAGMILASAKLVEPEWADPGDNPSCPRVTWREFRTVNRNQFLNTGTSLFLCALVTGVSVYVTVPLGATPAGMAAGASIVACTWILDRRDFITIQVRQVRDCERRMDGQGLRCNTVCFAWRDL